MNLTVDPPDSLVMNGRTFRCALGRGGVRRNKTEGDGATPVGQFSLRRVMYRADRLARPETGLPVAQVDRGAGWCDDPAAKEYNQPVQRPFAGHHETLWRDDGVYDVIVVISHNDAPPVPGKGSAIFLHVATPDYRPTEGCVALVLDDLLEILAMCGPGDSIRINPAVAAGGRRK